MTARTEARARLLLDALGVGDWRRDDAVLVRLAAFHEPEPDDEDDRFQEDEREAEDCCPHGVTGPSCALCDARERYVPDTDGDDYRDAHRHDGGALADDRRHRHDDDEPLSWDDGDGEDR